MERFYYSIELKGDGQVGYAQYKKQAQQEFLLELEHGFKVKEILFDSKSAVVKEQEPVEVYSSGKQGMLPDHLILLFMHRKM